MKRTLRKNQVQATKPGYFFSRCKLIAPGLGTWSATSGDTHLFSRKICDFLTG